MKASGGQDTEARGSEKQNGLKGYDGPRLPHKAHKKARDRRLLGTIVPYPAIDIQKSYFVAVSESGKGVLNRIQYNDDKVGSANEGPLRGAPTASTAMGRQRYKTQGGEATRSLLNQPNRNRNRIIFEEISPFQVGDEITDNADLCFLVEICLEHEIFIVARQKGQIAILSLSTCQTLAVLNKGIVNIPASLQHPRPQPNKRLQQLENAQHSKRRQHFLKYNA